jgi:hypothetical protein
MTFFCYWLVNAMIQGVSESAKYRMKINEIFFKIKNPGLAGVRWSLT